MQILLTTIKWVSLVFGCILFALFGLIFTRYAKLPDWSTLATQNPQTTQMMEFRKLEAFREGRTFKLDWRWIPLSEVSKPFIDTVVRMEDFRFWDHHGIEWGQIQNALKNLWMKRRIVTGGSTITQQVVKNLYLSPERSMVRKGVELLAAYNFEKQLSKERILEIYINLLELGEGIFGIESASQYWFHCRASELSPMQSIQMVLIIPSPRKRDPSNPSRQFSLLGNRLLFQLVTDGVVNSDELTANYLTPKS